MSIQSSINQAVNGMMSMIMPMSLLKEQGKVKQLKVEQEALKTSNEELKTSNEDLKKRNEKELKLWDDILDYSPGAFPSSDFLDLLNNPYSVGDAMASNVAQQRVDAERENKRKNQFENLQKAFNNIGMGGVNNG